MMRVFKFIVANSGNPELKIDDISNEIGMSRSVLYNKVKAGCRYDANRLRAPYPNHESLRIAAADQ